MSDSRTDPQLMRLRAIADQELRDEFSNPMLRLHLRQDEYARLLDAMVRVMLLVRDPEIYGKRT